MNSTLLPGIQVGKGAIIGTNSVLYEDVEAGTTVYGNPTKNSRNQISISTQR